MARFQPGEHIKAEFRDERSGESEWMWVEVESCDDERRLVFGHLDSQPVIHTDLKPGQPLAVSFDSIRDNRQF